MTNRAQIQACASRAREMYVRGVSKPDIFAALAADVDKPVQAARLVVSLPNPEGVQRYRISNRVLAIFIFIVAILAGLGKFAAGSNINLTAGVIAALVFFGIFAACAWGIWKVSWSAYSITVVLLFLSLTQTPRAMLAELAGPDYNPDGTSAIYFLLDLIFGLVLPIFLLWFTIRLRNNLFSKTKFFGGPRKDKTGHYVFTSGWEQRSAAPEIAARGDTMEGI